MCGVEAALENSFRDDVRVPAHCELFDEALDIYLNEYVQGPSAARSPASACIPACHLPSISSPSNPIFSFVPHTEPKSKRLG